MSQHPHNVRETMALQQRQKLESLHFEGQTAIDDQQHNICNF